MSKRWKVLGIKRCLKYIKVTLEKRLLPGNRVLPLRCFPPFLGAQSALVDESFPEMVVLRRRAHSRQAPVHLRRRLFICGDASFFKLINGRAPDWRPSPAEDGWASGGPLKKWGGNRCVGGDGRGHAEVEVAGGGCGGSWRSSPCTLSTFVLIFPPSQWCWNFSITLALLGGFPAVECRRLGIFFPEYILHSGGEGGGVEINK